MKGKTSWRASSTGPDWTDVSMLLREVERLHQVWASVRIVSGGLRNSNALRIYCTAFTSALVGTAAAGVVGVQMEWPNANNVSLEGTVYAGILRLDYKLTSEHWDQSDFLGGETASATVD